MNGQIVLCPGLNDKKELERTLNDLCEFIPLMQSVSVVPVGLTKYREGLYPLSPVDEQAAKETLSIIRSFRERIYAEHGIHFVHASDEIYLMAGEPIPAEEEYDG
jgi:NifB/MoaA-like Fe-S oxidoreductase